METTIKEMESKELFKILSMYLPYCIKGQIKSFEKELGTDIVCSLDNEHNLVSLLNLGTFEVSLFKPLLKPLSMLTETIEHDGESFVPIVELAKICYLNCFGYVEDFNKTEFLTESDNYGFIGFIDKERVSFTHDKEDKFYSFSFYVNGSEMKTNQFDLFQKLLEWKFDIADLIGQGYAIDSTTLTKTEY